MEMPSSFLIGAIITVILMSFSFMIGYKITSGIHSLEGKKRGFQFYKEIKDLTNYMYYQSTGSSKILDVSLKDETLCFVNPDDVEEYVNNNPYLSEYDKAGLKSLAVGEHHYNLYYHKRGDILQKYYVEHLFPSHTFCVNSTYKIYFVNNGSYIDVEPIMLR